MKKNIDWLGISLLVLLGLTVINGIVGLCLGTYNAELALLTLVTANCCFLWDIKKELEKQSPRTHKVHRSLDKNKSE